MTHEVNFTDLPGTYPDAWHDCLGDLDWHPILCALNKGEELEAGRLLMAHIEKTRGAVEEEVNMGDVT